MHERSGIHIEPLAPEHAPAIQRIASDPRVQATTLLPDPYPEDGAAQFIAFARETWGEAYRWAIVASGAVVGVIGIKEIHDGQGEVGYYVDPNEWERGFASAAVQQACSFAFEHAGLVRLTAHTLVSNEGSRRVLRRAGFEVVETMVNPFVKWPPEARVERYVREAARSASRRTLRPPPSPPPC